jgi:uncharacterized membrane protein
MSGEQQRRNEPTDGELAGVLKRNIHVLSAMRRRSDQHRTFSERLADAMSAFLGSMKSVVAHAAIFGAWLLINTGVVPGVRPFDPFPFVMLAMGASVEAIFISTFVLISQNRLSDLADKRAELDVQISLLTEHEVTRLIVLCDAMAAHLGVRISPGPNLEELKKDIEPEEVMTHIQQSGPAKSQGA